MRLINADLLEPDAEYDDGEYWAYSKRQIDEAPAVQQWIPCSERLPEKETYVLILTDTIAGKMVKVSFIYKDSAGRNCWSTLDEYGKNLFDLQPTHWMPIPEPWKGEDDE